VSARVAVDGRELRPGVRTGIRRYTLEVLRATADRGLDCVVYGDAGTALDAIPAGVSPIVLARCATPWWDQVSLPATLRRDGADVFLSRYYKRPLAAPCPVLRLFAYDPRALGRLVERAGFEVVSVLNSDLGGRSLARAVATVVARTMRLLSGRRWLVTPSIELHARRRAEP
jgi:hypothetical protein